MVTKILKFQYFGHLKLTADTQEKSLMLGKTEDRRRGYQRVRCLDGITSVMDMNLGKLRKMVRDKDTWCATVHGVTESDVTRWLNNMWLFKT